MLCELGRFAEALSSYDRALELEPIAANWLNRGTALDGMGRIDEAIDSYDKAIALEPTVPLPYINRAHALLRAGRADEALATAERAAEVGPKVAHAHLAKAQVQMALGQTEAALAAVDRALAVAPEARRRAPGARLVLTALGRAEEAESSLGPARHWQKDRNSPGVARVYADSQRWSSGHNGSGVGTRRGTPNPGALTMNNAKPTTPRLKTPTDLGANATKDLSGRAQRASWQTPSRST